MSNRILTFILLILIATFHLSAVAMDDYDQQQLMGYALIAESSVVGDFEGADFDKLVELDNGMIFRFTSYHYHYSYRPSAYVYAYHASVDEVRKVVPDATSDLTVYKLVIDDDLYDVTRVK